MATSNDKQSKLARIKKFLFTRVLPCCSARETPQRPIEIHPPKDFRRLEIKFDELEGLSPEQEAFLREKAFLDALPPTPPLPILSPTATATSTPAFSPPPTCTTTHSLIPHHNHHTSSYFPTYTSSSAPHLTTTPTHTSSSSTTTAVTAAHSHPHLRLATTTTTTTTTTTNTTTTENNIVNNRRSSRRFSAINLLRGSWNSSHPVSAEDRRIADAVYYNSAADHGGPPPPRRRQQRLASARELAEGDRRRQCLFEFTWEGEETTTATKAPERGFELQAVEGVGEGEDARDRGGWAGLRAGMDSDITLGGGGVDEVESKRSGEEKSVEEGRSERWREKAKIW